MRIKSSGFTANVALPGRIFVGANGSKKYSGIATNLESGRVSVTLQGSEDSDVIGDSTGISLGEEVWLELELPVQVESAKAKLLSVRAKGSALDSRPDGSVVVDLTFRKPSFKDLASAGTAPGRTVSRLSSAAGGWKM